MTHPIVGVILYKCVIVDASRSLSCGMIDHSSSEEMRRGTRATYRDLLLCYYYRGILSSDRNCCVSGPSYGFEGIF